MYDPKGFRLKRTLARSGKHLRISSTHRHELTFKGGGWKLPFEGTSQFATQLDGKAFGALAGLLQARHPPAEGADPAAVGAAADGGGCVDAVDPGDVAGEGGGELGAPRLHDDRPGAVRAGDLPQARLLLDSFVG